MNKKTEIEIGINPKAFQYATKLAQAGQKAPNNKDYQVKINGKTFYCAEEDIEKTIEKALNKKKYTEKKENTRILKSDSRRMDDLSNLQNDL